MNLQDTITLSNNTEMPRMALGTWLTPRDIAADVVKDAISVGFRHIDTAQAYGNEAEVGKGVRDSGIPREKVFVTTKVAAEIKEYNGAVRSIEASLSRLDLGYIDLMLIHAPMPWDLIKGPKRYFKENVEVWKALEKYYLAGKIRAIGVSNFNKQDISNIKANCQISPMADQIKIHPTKSQGLLCKTLERIGMAIEAYSPLGHGEILGHPELLRLAEKYECSVGQLCIKFSLQKGYCPVIKTTKRAHMEEYRDMSFFNISQEDLNLMSRLGSITNRTRDDS